MFLVTSEPRPDIKRKPRRIQRQRSKGWELPENTVCVDNSTPWGNPFIHGEHGTRIGCVRLYMALMAEGVIYSIDNLHQQRASLGYVDRHINELRGKNLACWCREGTPCHGDVLLQLANRLNGRDIDNAATP
jgi:hypothetical protein